MIMVLFGVSAALADQPNPDEQYIHIMTTIDKADALLASGKTAPALEKYRDAQTNLVRFKAWNPLFDPKTVQYRIDEVSGRINALTAPPERPAAETNAEAQPAPAAPKSPVKLMDPGSEPRKVLRFHSQPGDKQSTLMVIKSVVDTGTGSAPITAPAMTLPMDITTKGISPNGDINYEIVIGDITVADDTNLPPQTLQAVKTAMSAAKGVTITGLMSDRGISKKTDVKAPPGSTPQLQQMVEQMKEGFSNMDSPLPEEAVGPGAKWEIQRPLKTQGLSGQQTESYQLVSLDGDHFNTSLVLNTASSNQVMQITSTLTGTNSADLSKIAPIQAAWNIHAEANASGPRPIATKSDTSIEMESK
ncbi:MAG TPA: hypothetical protein VMH87_19240 [Pseudomonadales bacterium]|nr:hypothetical protein [Pseudomonadales bacterium]